MDLLILKRRTMLSRPGDAFVVTDLEKQSELLVKELVIVSQIQTEERIGLGEGTVTALVRRIRLVRAAAAANRTTGAESRNSCR